eukprot:jgi/Mesvir1/26065/Mv06791-RA.1
MPSPRGPTSPPQTVDQQVLAGDVIRLNEEDDAEAEATDWLYSVSKSKSRRERGAKRIVGGLKYTRQSPRSPRRSPMSPRLSLSGERGDGFFVSSPRSPLSPFGRGPSLFSPPRGAVGVLSDQILPGGLSSGHVAGSATYGGNEVTHEYTPNMSQRSSLATGSSAASGGPAFLAQSSPISPGSAGSFTSVGHRRASTFDQLHLAEDFEEVERLVMEGKASPIAWQEPPSQGSDPILAPGPGHVHPSPGYGTGHVRALSAGHSTGHSTGHGHHPGHLSGSGSAPFPSPVPGPGVARLLEGDNGAIKAAAAMAMANAARRLRSEGVAAGAYDATKAERLLHRSIMADARGKSIAGVTDGNSSEDEISSTASSGAGGWNYNANASTLPGGVTAGMGVADDSIQLTEDDMAGLMDLAQQPSFAGSQAPSLSWANVHGGRDDTLLLASLAMDRSDRLSAHGGMLGSSSFAGSSFLAAGGGANAGAGGGSAGMSAPAAHPSGGNTPYHSANRLAMILDNEEISPEALLASPGPVRSVARVPSVSMSWAATERAGHLALDREEMTWPDRLRGEPATLLPGAVNKGEGYGARGGGGGGEEPGEGMDKDSVEGGLSERDHAELDEMAAQNEAAMGDMGDRDSSAGADSVEGDGENDRAGGGRGGMSALTPGVPLVASLQPARSRMDAGGEPAVSLSDMQPWFRPGFSMATIGSLGGAAGGADSMTAGSRAHAIHANRANSAVSGMGVTLQPSVHQASPGGGLDLSTVHYSIDGASLQGSYYMDTSQLRNTSQFKDTTQYRDAASSFSLNTSAKSANQSGGASWAAAPPHLRPVRVSADTRKLTVTPLTSTMDTSTDQAFYTPMGGATAAAAAAANANASSADAANSFSTSSNSGAAPDVVNNNNNNNNNNSYSLACSAAAPPQPGVPSAPPSGPQPSARPQAGRRGTTDGVLTLPGGSLPAGGAPLGGVGGDRDAGRTTAGVAGPSSVDAGAATSHPDMGMAVRYATVSSVSLSLAAAVARSSGGSRHTSFDSAATAGDDEGGHFMTPRGGDGELASSGRGRAPFSPPQVTHAVAALGPTGASSKHRSAAGEGTGIMYFEPLVVPAGGNGPGGAPGGGLSPPRWPSNPPAEGAIPPLGGLALATTSRIKSFPMQWLDEATTPTSPGIWDPPTPLSTYSSNAGPLHGRLGDHDSSSNVFMGAPTTAGGGLYDSSRSGMYDSIRTISALGSPLGAPARSDCDSIEGRAVGDKYEAFEFAPGISDSLMAATRREAQAAVADYKDRLGQPGQRGSASSNPASPARIDGRSYGPNATWMMTERSMATEGSMLMAAGWTPPSHWDVLRGHTGRYRGGPDGDDDDEDDSVSHGSAGRGLGAGGPKELSLRDPSSDAGHAQGGQLVAGGSGSSLQQGPGMGGTMAGGKSASGAAEDMGVNGPAPGGAEGGKSASFRRRVGTRGGSDKQHQERPLVGGNDGKSGGGGLGGTDGTSGSGGGSGNGPVAWAMPLWSTAIDRHDPTRSVASAELAEGGGGAVLAHPEHKTVRQSGMQVVVDAGQTPTLMSSAPPTATPVMSSALLSSGGHASQAAPQVMPASAGASGVRGPETKGEGSKAEGVAGAPPRTLLQGDPGMGGAKASLPLVGAVPHVVFHVPKTLLSGEGAAGSAPDARTGADRDAFAGNGRAEMTHADDPRNQPAANRSAAVGNGPREAPPVASEAQVPRKDQDPVGTLGGKEGTPAVGLAPGASQGATPGPPSLLGTDEAGPAQGTALQVKVAGGAKDGAADAGQELAGAEACVAVGSPSLGIGRGKKSTGLLEFPSGVETQGGVTAGEGRRTSRPGCQPKCCVVM